MPGKTIYPSIPQAGNDLPSLRVAVDAMRQTLTMLIMNAQNPSANFTPSTASQIFVTHEDLKKTGVVGPQGPTGPQGPPGPGIDEAPNDVNTYGRHALTWVPVTGGGSGISEAPNDGTAYARKSLNWAHLTTADLTDLATVLAGYLPKVGVTDGSQAAAGQIGEVLATGGGTITFPGATWVNTVTLALTPGDWDVSGEFKYNPGAVAPNNIAGGISTSPTAPVGGSFFQLMATLIASSNLTFPLRTCRFNVTANTNIYLPVYAATAGNGTGLLLARRAR